MNNDNIEKNQQSLRIRHLTKSVVAVNTRTCTALLIPIYVKVAEHVLIHVTILQ